MKLQKLLRWIFVVAAVSVMIAVVVAEAPDASSTEKAREFPMIVEVEPVRAEPMMEIVKRDPDNYVCAEIEDTIATDEPVEDTERTLEIEEIQEDVEPEAVYEEPEIYEPGIEEAETAEDAVYSEPTTGGGAFDLSGLSAEEIDAVLVGTPLEGCGEHFEAVESYGVSAKFAVAVAHLESSLGQYQANTNNFFGFRGGNGWMTFETPGDCIDYFGKLLSSDLYAGKTIEQIASIYCPGTPSWAPDVRWLMKHDF